MVTVVGNAGGVYLQVIAVAFGIGAIVEQYVAAFTIVKLAGAGYLDYLGVQSLRHRQSLVASLHSAVEAKATRRILRDSFVVGVTNPKSVIFFTAVLRQFINRSASDIPIQLLLLGAIFIALALVAYSVWAMAAGMARSWLARSPRRLGSGSGCQLADVRTSGANSRLYLRGPQHIGKLLRADVPPATNDCHLLAGEAVA